MVPRVCQFTENYGALEYVNLQRFYGAPSMSIYRDFVEISRGPEYVNLQTFYGAPSMSIDRDFMVPRVCQISLQRFCGDFIVPRVCQFTEILWCPVYVNLQ